MKQHKFLYLEVTNDKYELPVVVAITLKELGEKVGKDVPWLSRLMDKERPKAPYIYRKVEIDEWSKALE